MRLDAVFALLLALTCVAPARSHEGHQALAVRGITISTGALELTTDARQNLGIELGQVTVGPLEEVFHSTCRASVPPESRLVLTSRVQGKVSRLKVRLGERVLAGQELLELDSLQVQEASLELARIAAELRLTRANYDRARSLVAPGIAPQKEMLELDAQARKLEIAIAGQETRLAALGVRPEDVPRARDGQAVSVVVLSSPAAGVVIDFPASRGKVVLTGAPLIEVADTARILVEGQVTAAQLPRLAAGQPARVTFSSLPGRVYQGRVDLLGRAIDETTRALPVFVEIPNTDDLVRPEMFGDMEIVTWRQERAIICPADALVPSGGDLLALSFEEGRYVARTAVAGHRQDDRVEILSGLFPGDRVIVRGNHELATFFAPETLAVSARARRNMGLASGEAEMKPLDRVLSIPAVVQVPPPQRSFASSRVGGRVERVLVRAGSSVHAGQVLAQVRSLEAGALVVDYQKARASSRFLTEALGRTQSLVDQKVAAARELVTAKSEVAVANGEAENYRRRLESLGIEPPETPTDLPLVPITAPTDGVVFHSEVELGGQVEPDRHLMEIVDTRRVWIEGELPEGEASQVKPGQAVRARLLPYPGRVLAGTVAFVEPIVDKGHRAVHVVMEAAADQKLQMEDGTSASPSHILPGMLAQLTLVLGTTEETVRVPRSAVIADGVDNTLFLLDGVKFRRVRIVLGRQDDRFVEVLRGVYPGEEIVTVGAEALRTAAMAVR